MREDMTIKFSDLPNWAQNICKQLRMRPREIRVQVAVEHDNIGHNWHDANVRRMYFYRGGQINEVDGLDGETAMNGSVLEQSLYFGAKVTLRNTDMVLATNTMPKSAELFVHPDSVPKYLQEVPHVE